jgi:hypothetical protein
MRREFCVKSARKNEPQGGDLKFQGEKRHKKQDRGEAEKFGGKAP